MRFSNQLIILHSPYLKISNDDKSQDTFLFLSEFAPSKFQKIHAISVSLENSDQIFFYKGRL